jgi:hypothetical protein
MNIPTLRTRNIFTLVIIVLVLLLLYVAWRILFFGTAVIRIQGPHNSLLTRVNAASKVVLPTGEEGRIYVLDSSIGSKEVTVSGPLIEKLTFSVDVQSLTDIEQDIEVTALSTKELANNLIEPPDRNNISDSRVFGNTSNWLVVEISRPNFGNGRYFYVYQYDFDFAEWVFELEGVKIGLENLPGKQAPRELIEYLEVNAGD